MVRQVSDTCQVCNLAGRLTAEPAPAKLHYVINPAIGSITDVSAEPRFQFWVDASAAGTGAFESSETSRGFIHA